MGPDIQSEGVSLEFESDSDSVLEPYGVFLQLFIDTYRAYRTNCSRCRRSLFWNGVLHSNFWSPSFRVSSVKHGTC